MMRRVLLLSILVSALAGCQSSPARGVDATDEEGREAAVATAEPSSSSPSRSQPEPREAAGDFAAWVAAFRRQARSEGIGERTLAEAFDPVRYQPRIIELDRSQPEFVRPIWEYLDTAVSATRVAQGRRRLAEHLAAGEAAERRYGVPREVITAIWGIESNYGANFGDYSTIDALATLGFDGRRRDFARGELMAALRILEAGDIERARMKGSWAGAMGHTQFIPSSFEAYAVDGDGDGRRDIWGSIDDVMASTANYLARAGWQAGQPWGVEVRLPDGFDYAQTELATRLSSQQWVAQGVAAVDGGGLPTYSAASIIAPAGASGPAFLVGPNYRAILRYNNATSYALAVGTLADRLEGRDGVTQTWPRQEKPLSRAQVREMQRRLNERGFDTGTPDGVMGPNTRAGLRDFQRASGLTPDGFATQRLLERLRDA